jgi:MFS family permease
VALLGALQFLPFLLFTLPAGAWVDRLRRRPILISGDLVRVVALGTIPVTWALGRLTIWQLYLVSFVAGIATVFFDVAYQSYLPALVERDELVEGNAKLQASEASAGVVGPGLGGALIGLVGAPFAIIADAASYLASALFVSRIERAEPHPEAERRAAGLDREPIRRQIAEGLRYVLGNRYLRAIAGATSSSNLFSNMIFAIIPVYLYRELGLSAATVGVIFGIGALGTLGGALVANQIAGRVGLGRAIVASIALDGPAMLLLAIAPRGAPVAWLVASVALGGLLGGRLQRQPGELPAGDHADRDPGSDERHDALPRLGNHPHRRDRWWPGGHRGWRPQRDLDRRARLVPALPLGAAVTGADAAHHAGAAN